MGIGRVIIFLGICFGIWMALRWFMRTPPEQVSKVLVKVTIGAGVAFVVILAATGHLHPLFARNTPQNPLPITAHRMRLVLFGCFLTLIQVRWGGRLLLGSWQVPA